jgi:protein N-terminal methyltransferase
MEKENVSAKNKWYFKTKTHWANSESTIKGMLGGYEEVHGSDVKTSCELLEGLIKLNKIKTSSVIDCGAGIGRVTKSILVNYFKKIDIMEQDEKFVQTCRESFKDDPLIGNIYQNSLQDFKFEKTYEVIWIQWCLENLEDDDIILFMEKCKNALEKTGKVIIKENITEQENNNKFSDEDYSKMRTMKSFRRIFKKSGFKIYKQFIHPNWPDDLVSVGVFVLKLH